MIRKNYLKGKDFDGKYEKDITVYLEYSLEQEKIYDIFFDSFKTEKTSFYTLWIKQEDFEKIKKLKRGIFNTLRYLKLIFLKVKSPPSYLKTEKL